MTRPRRRSVFGRPGKGAPGVTGSEKQTKSQTRLVDGKRLFALHDLTVEKARALEAQDFGDGIVGVSLNGESEDDRSETPEDSAKTARRRKSKA